MNKMLRLFSLTTIILITSSFWLSAQTEKTENKAVVLSEDLDAFYKKNQEDLFMRFFVAQPDDAVLEKAREGDPDAQYEVGMNCIQKPHGMIENAGEKDREALGWLEKAAAQGHKEAMIEAGIIQWRNWISGGGIDNWAKRQAMNYLIQGGAGDDSVLMMFLADMAYSGDIEQRIASVLSKEMNRENLPGAQMILINNVADWTIIYKGYEPYHNKSCDMKEALSWCSNAIKRGLLLEREEFPAGGGRSIGPTRLCDAYRILAGIYRLGGEGISINPKKSFEYLQLAVKYGDKYSMIKLAEYYYLGFGTKMDKERAIQIWKSNEDSDDFVVRVALCKMKSTYHF